MARFARGVAVLLALAGAVTAVLVSRHTTARTVDAAVSAPQLGVTSAAQLPVLEPGPPPSVEAADGWLNTTGVTGASLGGRVVLYEFWTFACINCRHTLSHVKAWQTRYARDGLMIVAIHTPEFDFEAVPKNVADYVTENEITYAVALDPHRDVWRAWDNHYWPAFYLYDATGRLRLRHFGEGSYNSTENAIRTLLEVDPASPRADIN
ncbi:MAG: redoxin domain-containing protein [Ilumatobacteraceae bacterium]